MSHVEYWAICMRGGALNESLWFCGYSASGGPLFGARQDEARTFPSEAVAIRELERLRQPATARMIAFPELLYACLI